VRAVIQRTRGASVAVEGNTVAEFEGEGLVALIGVTHEDTSADAELIARKISDLRILSHERSASDVDAPIIVVSQFTLYADVKKGRRPTWNQAARGDVAEPLVDEVVSALRQRGLTVETGVFGADMQVSLVNDGPVTLIVESEGLVSYDSAGGEHRHM